MNIRPVSRVVPYGRTDRQTRRT